MSEPKTQRGRRSVSLDPVTVGVLREHRVRQLEERLLLGASYNIEDWIFCNPEGDSVHPESFSKVFDRRVTSSGLPRISFHGLRHTWATLALRAGVHPKVVSDRLGHARVSFTLDVYSHAVPVLERETADKVAALVFGPHGGV